MGMNEDLQKQLINDLLIESFEGLDRFDQYLARRRRATAGRETLNGIFRRHPTRSRATSGLHRAHVDREIGDVGENHR